MVVIVANGDNCDNKSVAAGSVAAGFSLREWNGTMMKICAELEKEVELIV